MKRYFRTWQDAVIGVGGIALSVGLLPLVFSSQASPLATSALLAAVLWSYVVAFGSLKLRLSTVAVGIQATLWTVEALKAILR